MGRLLDTWHPTVLVFLLVFTFLLLLFSSFTFLSFTLLARKGKKAMAHLHWAIAFLFVVYSAVSRANACRTSPEK